MYPVCLTKTPPGVGVLLYTYTLVVGGWGLCVKNLGWDISDSGSDILLFSSVTAGKCCDSTSIMQQQSPSKYFQIHHSSCQLILYIVHIDRTINKRPQKTEARVIQTVHTVAQTAVCQKMGNKV
jgi:hypothetical protein